MLPPTFAMVHLLHRLYGVHAPACDDWYTIVLTVLTIGTVYQSSNTVKNSQKTVKTAKMTMSHVYTESAEYTKSASASAEYTKPIEKLLYSYLLKNR